MEPHHISHRVVQDQVDRIEVDDLRKAPGQVMKQLGEVAVRRDRLRDVQERPVPFHQKVSAGG